MFFYPPTPFPMLYMKKKFSKFFVKDVLMTVLRCVN